MDAASYVQDRVAIVTGAASGIGRALATALVAHGAGRVVLADRDGEGARAAADALGPAAVAAEVDVTDRAAVADLVGEVDAAGEGLDFLFNNAGIGSGGPVQDLPADGWRQVVEVDLMGVVHGVEAAYPRMVARERGHIVNTASLAGLVPSPLLTPYAAAKAGVVGLTVSLRVEAAAYGVRVCAVCPGPVETALLAEDAGAGRPISVRRLLTNALGEPIGPDVLAGRVLAGMAEDRALIVEGETPAAFFGHYRADPEAVLRVMMDQAVASRARREGGSPGAEPDL
jgi:NAD(P)-dependent dehydrogenase (short-subunit alcohol dehydrogenase family)